MRSYLPWRLGLLGVLVALLPIAGCGSTTGLLDDTASSVTNGASNGSTQAPLSNVGAKPISRLVSFRAPTGPPDDVNAELLKHLNDAAIDFGIALVVDPNVKTDLTLRGYMAALKKGSAVNLTYLWDVLDQRGQRINRFEGEEVLSGNVDVKAPWTAINPAVSRSIAQRSMTQIGAWLKTQNTSQQQKATGAPSAQVTQPASSAVGTPRGGTALSVTQ